MASPVNDWEGNSHSHLEGCVIVYCNNKTEELHDEVLEIFLAGNTKENCKSLKPVSVHYRNEA